MRQRLLVGFIVVGVAGAAQATVIDDFSQGTYFMAANSGAVRAEAVRTGLASLLAGGERDAMVEYSVGPQSVEAQVAAGAQFFSAQSQTGGVLYLQYDGVDGESELDFVQSPGAGLGLNLSGSDAFLFDFRFVNGGLSAPVSILTTVTASNGSFSFNTNVSSGTFIMHTVAFSNFGAANFGDVRRLDFAITGPASADFTLDMIATHPVPEPASMLALGVGAMALLRRRRAR